MNFRVLMTRVLSRASRSVEIAFTRLPAETGPRYPAPTRGAVTVVDLARLTRRVSDLVQDASVAESR